MGKGAAILSVKHPVVPALWAISSECFFKTESLLRILKAPLSGSAYNAPLTVLPRQRLDSIRS
jgi:hypothetical protein